MAQPATVLILAEVDDADRVALVAACTDAGFSPTVEPSAEVATGKLGQKRFDALVVHMGTPGAALACMRARGKLLRIRVPVLALADTEDDAAFARAYRAGADEVLVLGQPAELTARLLALPKPSIPQPGNARGDAVVADPDRTRAEVIERVLRDAGFRVEVVGDGFAARLQAGRPSLKVAVLDASLDDVPALIAQARAKGARCAWVVRARPEVLDDLRQKLASLQRVAVVSAYGPPDDVLFETNRMLEPREGDGNGRADPRLLYGTIVRLRWKKDGSTRIGYTYNVSPLGLFVRSVVGPVGETVEIEVAPPGSDTKVLLEGKIAWRREFGTTRKEPVPAGFGIQITGGNIGAWAEACPRAPSLRPRMPDEVRPPAAPRISLPVPRRVPADPVAGIVTPGEIDIQPREPQSSVEEMLASVLSETIPGDDPGATPLSIDGGNVVELKDGEEAASNAAPSEIEVSPPTTPMEEKPEDRPTVVPGVPGIENVPQIEAHEIEAHEIEAHEITSASLGFQDLEEITRAEGEVPNRHQASEDDLFASLGTLDTIPAPSLASVESEASPRSPGFDTSPRGNEPSVASEGTSPPARVAPVSSVPPSARGSRDSEIRLPTTGPSPAVWVLAAIVLGGAAAFMVVPKRAVETPPHPSASPTATPLATTPEPPAATAADEPTASAPVEAPEPSAAELPAAAAPGVAPAEADPAALASLKKGEGFLYVTSPLATNVYVYGLLAGTTNQRLTTKCGPRFLRLGTRPGAWQTEGVVQIVKCGALTRVEMVP